MKGHVMGRAVLVLGAAVAVSCSWAAEVARARVTSTATGMRVQLTAGQPQFETSSPGNQRLVVPGLASAGVTGAPELPGRLVRIALPIDTRLSTVACTVQPVPMTPLRGRHALSPAPMAAASVNGEFRRAMPGLKLANGKDMSVYGTNAYYDPEVCTFLGVQQMGRWKIAEVYYSPFDYNPVTGSVRVAGVVTFDLSYKGADPLPADLAGRTSWDAAASGMLDNYGDPALGYTQTEAPGAKGTGDYVIITTSAIQAGSTQLANFVTHKQGRGFGVQVVTEGTWGGGTGDTAAQNLRSYLQSVYAGWSTDYVLLIGNPDPSTGNVPMKMTWPRSLETSDRQSPTDYYYADLTSNWNGDGDGLFGEWGTGQDFTSKPLHEVYVGRIPVYGTSYTALDTILAKTITYENATTIAWRKNALMPMAISNYANEDASGDQRCSGYKLAEYLVNDLLSGASFGYWRLYEEAGLTPVTATHDQALTEANVRNRWAANTYGIVDWWGHGSSTAASRKYWAADSNSNGVPEAGEMTWTDFFNSGDPASLDDTHPSVVCQVSCNNGYPEVTNNLGYSLLAKGAIGTYCGTRVTWYAVCEYYPSLGGTYGENASYAYYSTKRFLENQYTESTGMALQWCRENLGTSWGGTSWMNCTDFNLYGDPAVIPYSFPPEIDVLGNGVSITDGDATPSAADHTDFGSVTQGMPAVSRTYTVRNHGGANLTLGTPTVPAHFSVSEPLDATLAPGTSDTFTVTLSTATAGTFTGDVSVSTNDSDENPYNFRITGTVISPCEIKVEGNGQDIADGETTATFAEDTSFGTVNQGAAVVQRTYTVRNLGGSALTTGAVSLPAGFTLFEGLSASIAGGGSDTFTVEMGTGTPGVFSGQVSIPNNDSDENPFNFAIAGAVLSPPEIEVTGNGLPIADGDASPTPADGTDFGPANQGAPAVQTTFVVRNLGGQTLTVGGVSLPAGYVLTDPLAGSLPGGAADAFTVALPTGTPGLFSGQISFTNNDANGGDGVESPFNFSITGRVLSYPEVEVRGNGLVIADGDTTPSAADDTDFGAVNQGATAVTRTYTVRNLGQQTLTLGAVSVPAGFMVAEPLAGSLGSGGTDTFTVRLPTTTAGTFSGEASFATNDGDEDPTSFAIAGQVLSPPEIEVTGNGLVIADGDATPATADDTDFGTLNQGGAAVARTYTVRNLGDQTLTLGAVSVPAGYTLTEPLAGSLAGGAADTFTVTLGTGTAGTFAGDVSVSTNDADGGDGVEDPFNLAITGRVLSLPEVEVRGNGLVIADGDSSPDLADDTDFGAVNQGAPAVFRTYTVTNVGEQTLLLGPVGVSGAFTLTEPLVASLAGGASDTFTVKLETATAGVFPGGILFGNNDADGGDGVEDPFNYRILGRVTVPEMDVYGLGLAIASGDMAPRPEDDTDFGAGDVGGAGGVAHTFTVQDPGTGALSLYGSPAVLVEGPDPGDFSVTVQPSSPVAAGASTSFEVTFAPLVTGLRRAVVRIANDDPDEDPYEFAVQGTGYVNQPIASFTAAPRRAACGEVVTFNASASSIDRPDRNIARYEWDFDSDGVYEESNPGPITTHAFTQFGVYPVTLRVVDNNLPPRTDTAVVVVVVDQGNQAPVAAAGGPYVVTQGSDLALDGSGSADPDTGCGDSITQYEWDLECDGIYEDIGVSPTVPWAALAGLPVGVPVPVCLRVTDEFGFTGADGTTITVTADVALKVMSDPEINVPIAGTHPGTTEYSQALASGTAVELTAPWQHAGQQFLRWKDPAAATLSSAATYAFTITGNTVVIAEYGAVTEFYVDDDGNDASPGTSPAAPMQHLQALLDRYPDIGAGCTVYLAAGLYLENVVVGGNHGGLTVAGVSDEADPAIATHLVGQGGAANLDVLLVTASGTDAAHPTTVRSLRVSSPDGLDAGPLYGGITLDATPGAKGSKPPPANGLVQFVRLEDLTVTGVTGDGAGCGILITGSSASRDSVSDVAVAGCRLLANDHAGLLVTDVRLARLGIGADGGGRSCLFLANGGSGLFLLGDPSMLKDLAQFSELGLCATTFCDNAPYDIELCCAGVDIDATQQVAFVGCTSLAEVEACLWHQVDDPLLGLISVALPSFTGNRLSWDRSTYQFTFNGAHLLSGTQWCALGTPSGAQAQIRVLPGTGTATATVLAIDLTGGDHSDAIPVTVNNGLCYRWYLRGTALTRLSEVSTLGGSQQIATYDAALNRTTYGRTAKSGLWLLAHDVFSWDRLLLAIVPPAP